MPTFRLIALLATCLLAACATPGPQAPAAQAPRTVIVLSFDGLPASTVGDGSMLTLERLAREGVRAEWMRPSYPTFTFPNHYTLATGLRPDHHGIIHNYMRDAQLGGYHSKENGSDARWYGGEPIWTTLQKQGGRAAMLSWIGAQSADDPRMPALWTAYDRQQTDEGRIAQLLAWMDLPQGERPQLLMAYFDRYDLAAHAHGPRSSQARVAKGELDTVLERVMEGLQARGMRDSTDVIVLSDHGMTEVPPQNVDVLGDAVPQDAYDVVAVNILLGLVPRPGREKELSALLGRHGHHTCYRKDALPARWHYGTHPRVPPIVCQADAGWYLYPRPPAQLPRGVRGEHGYDPDVPDMRAVFVADGPSFRDGVRIGGFDNVDVYPLLARLLKVQPAPNDGRIAPLLPALRPPH